MESELDKVLTIKDLIEEQFEQVESKLREVRYSYQKQMRITTEVRIRRLENEMNTLIGMIKGFMEKY